MMARDVTDLPQPGLADQADGLARRDVEADAVDGLDVASSPPVKRTVRSRTSSSACQRWSRVCGSSRGTSGRGPRASASPTR